MDREDGEMEREERRGEGEERDGTGGEWGPVLFAASCLMYWAVRPTLASQREAIR